eukprot:TRINITY_DN3049_c0_g2_i1.p1 TRINITY_DN3049_c0_g2~~TRINITY_DN3049_c0_g2_i1.p1  ORF type:complete len:280 (+),score=75.57 TRINITY_DN3049_c0_g2_i1:385-1224(+)
MYFQAELRASVFEAIEEEDRSLEHEENVTPALLGSCNDRAKQLHASSVGKLLTALICDYFEWAQLDHTLKVYLPECNLPRGFWRSELKENLGLLYESDDRNDRENGPLLLQVLETFLKSENALGSTTRSNPSKVPSEGASTSASDDSIYISDRRSRRPSASLAGSAVPQGRFGQASSESQKNSGHGNASERTSDGSSYDYLDMGASLKASSSVAFAGTSKENSSFTNMRKEDDVWKYHADDQVDVLKASDALENIKLDRKARNLTSSWRNNDGGGIESD